MIPDRERNTALRPITMRILIIEDNADIVANLYSFLESRGHVLDSAANGYAGFALAAQHEYDAIILDIKLPGMDGLALCRKLRDELQNTTPVLMLTARDTLDDKVAGFDSGADDYLIKPFSLVEVDVRLKALVRRARGKNQTSNFLSVGDLQFDTSTYQVKRNGVPITLTKTGFKILTCLMKEAPKVVTREALELEVWGDHPPDSDALRTHIHALRQALDKSHSFAMLRTVQGIGYRLVAPDEAS
jgi:DNA-binding response OmpR family regulator